MKPKKNDGGKLRIGDDWNAIRIIALSQSNPLKAIAEFVENSIDAKAERSRSRGAANTASTIFRSGMTAMACRAIPRACRTSSMWRPISAIRSSGA